MLAKAFDCYVDDQTTIIFASGVSNSKEASPAAFAREAQLLAKVAALAQTGVRLVYFGTCSVTDPAISRSSYVRHKLEMEGFVTATAPKFTIVRLPNVVGGKGNPHLLVNYFYEQIERHTFFAVWNRARRNLIGVEDARAMVDFALQHGLASNRIIEIASSRFWLIEELVQAIERHLETRADYEILEGGGAPAIDTGLSADIATRLGICFDDDYLRRMLLKYYPRT